MVKGRRRLTSQEKVAVLRRHLLDKLAGREEAIWAARDRKLETAREERKQRRRSAAPGLDSLAVAAIN